MLSGSYLPEDVTFLLKEINITSTSVEQKEVNIQKNKQHYSQMLTFEKAPTEQYMNLFYDCLDDNGLTFAENICHLAQKIAKDYEDQEEIVIVSLARAGTPVGVLLKRYIDKILHKKVKHYCISIIRDVGVDNNALQHILKIHSDTSIVFVDGWTGKGVIGKQLKESVTQFNTENNTIINSNLYVIADISGTAHYSATYDDYLLPSAILNSTISGLVSRTVYNLDYLSEKDFHGCVVYNNLQEHDISQWFVDTVFNTINIMCKHYVFIENLENKKQSLRQASQNVIQFFKDTLNISDVNYIKPGIGESTRVMLRRVPQELWVKDISQKNVEHLVYLAKNKDVPIYTKPDLAYHAVAIIKELD